MSITLQQLLQEIPDDTREQVDRTRKRINAEVREAIKRETGLALNRKDIGQSRTNISVPVVLVPGIPEALQDIEYEDDYDLLLKISPFRRDLEAVRDSLENIKPLLKILETDNHCEDSLKDKNDHVELTRSLISKLLKKFNEKEEPVKKILGVNKDVLGAYIYSPMRTSFPQGRIELYWGVIGVVAGMLRINVEPLTAVVLIHEISHAYTHLGADIDGERWESDDFAKSERALKEGLAQYYTCLIRSQIDNKVTGTSIAFEKLLEHQPTDYHSHKMQMIEDSKVEDIRLALLDVRRKGISTLGDFRKTLEGIIKHRFFSKL